MSANESVEYLARKARAELYRLVVEIGVDETPLLLLFVAAIHESMQYAKERVLRKLDQLRLPASRQVLDELWKQAVEIKDRWNKEYDELNRMILLHYDRVVRPDDVSEQDLAECDRTRQRSRYETQPVFALFRSYCGLLPDRENEQEKQQRLDRCPLFKSWEEKFELLSSGETPPTALVTGIGKLKWDRCPSLVKLWRRVFDRTAIKTEDGNGDARSRDLKSPSDVDIGKAACSAFLLAPIAEIVEAISIRFEESTFLSIAERVDQVFAVSEPNPGGTTEADQHRNTGPAAPPRGDEGPADPLVILGESDEEPMVRGVRKNRLSLPRFDVVKALLAAGQRGLSKDMLATKSNHSDAHRILKRLGDSDPDWSSVILMAGKPGGRYRIRSTDPPTSPGISRKAPMKRNKV